MSNARKTPAKKPKTLEDLVTFVRYRDFLRVAYCGLVLRGYGRERDIPDPILRKVWRLGKKAHLENV